MSEEFGTVIHLNNNLGDVNAVNLERNKANFDASLGIVNDFESEEASLLSNEYDESKDNELCNAITDISDNIKVKGNTVTNLKNKAPRKAKRVCNEDDDDIIANHTGTCKIEHCFDIHSILPNEGAKSSGEAQTEQCKDRKRFDTHIRFTVEETYSIGEVLTNNEKQNETLSMFLIELYDKEVDIESNFSEQEILNIRTAVDEQVHLLAETIGEVDSRLKLREVIPVGSAREGTQIVRPCEYDYILILETLSQPGGVSLKFCSYDRQYMYVTLEDSETRALFQGYIGKNGRINAGEFSSKGLRSLFLAIVARAVIRCSKTSVEKSTGTLTCRPTKPETHGPAFPIMFKWQGNTTRCSAPMKISIDLCPALKVDWTVYKNCLQSIDGDLSTNFIHHIQHVGSVLLMPSHANLFKVTLTEAELLLTSALSEHHI